jgi:hypothetical protein
MARPRKKATTGGRKGSRQRGYWYRAGRGWYTTDHGRKIPLQDERGNHYKDRRRMPDCQSGGSRAATEDAKPARPAGAENALANGKPIPDWLMLASCAWPQHGIRCEPVE